MSLVFEAEPRVVAVGARLFADALADQGVRVAVADWRPPAGGDPALAAALGRLWTPRVDAANREALDRLLAAQPVLVDVRRAGDVIPGLTRDTLLHAGPPITWERMSGPLRGAVIGALLFEGLAETPEAAETLAASGSIRFDPCHHHRAVGPMAGVTSASMPVYVVENRAAGTVAYSTLNEGLGRVLRYGAYDAEVLARLRWMRDVLGPTLARVLARLPEGLDVRALIAQALHMGDECHNRNRAASALLLRTLAAEVAALDDVPAADRREVLRFAAANEHSFLNVGMAACKSALDAAHGVSGSTLVTTMARNGTDFGIRLSGTGDAWFTGPAQVPSGLYFAGASADDANPDIGDSAITETAGLGGFAMAGAPAIVQFVGGSPDDALAYTRRMYEITLAEHPAYSLPILGFRGTPVGIDARLVVQTGLLPQINTGIASRRAGVGQIGAGLVNPPMACFEQALLAAAAGAATLGS